MITSKPAGVRVRVTFNGELIADTRDALLFEDAYYVPRQDVKMERLIRTSHTSYCPDKGHATYFTICNGQIARHAVWSYERPLPEMMGIKERLAFYPDKVEITTSAD
jgi:uncharacterized protein (DUF427 family)